MRPACPRFLSILLALRAASPLVAQAPSAPEVITAYRRLAGHPVWPGFDPLLIPVAIYDGDTTWLAGHPRPPQDTFQVTAGGWYRMPGQHPLVKANTSEEIGGEATATLLLDRTRALSATTWAGTLTHEAFHVYQRLHHKDWAANEGEYFTYPVENQAAQGLQRLETEAWRRAVTGEQPLCWARTALEYRRLRFALLPVDAVAYERGSELNEGLATYVEYRTERRDTIPFPPEGFGPDGVRLRAYVLGPAIGEILDRALPTWRDQLEVGPTRALDELLAEALPGGARCRFTAVEADSARTLARADVERVRREHLALRDSVLSAPGWSLEVLADSGSPLWPQRFDPWNVVSVGDGAIVHRRFLSVYKEGLKIEILNRAALTEPMGRHPLFNGIRRLLVTGLPDAPVVIDRPGRLEVSAGGVHLEGRVRSVDRAGRTIVIRAGP
jgi:hypothetical protein